MHCSKRDVDCLGRNGKRTLNQERYRDNDFQEIAEVTGVLQAEKLCIRIVMYWTVIRETKLRDWEENTQSNDS